MLFIGVGTTKIVGGEGQIDSFEPATKEDFDKFHELLRDKVTKYEVLVGKVAKYFHIIISDKPLVEIIFMSIDDSKTFKKTRCNFVKEF